MAPAKLQFQRTLWKIRPLMTADFSALAEIEQSVFANPLSLGRSNSALPDADINPWVIRQAETLSGYDFLAFLKMNHNYKT